MLRQCKQSSYTDLRIVLDSQPFSFSLRQALMPPGAVLSACAGKSTPIPSRIGVASLLGEGKECDLRRIRKLRVRVYRLRPKEARSR